MNNYSLRVNRLPIFSSLKKGKVVKKSTKSRKGPLRNSRIGELWIFSKKAMIKITMSKIYKWHSENQLKGRSLAINLKLTSN